MHISAPVAHAHLVGIGGVSMSPLAEVLHGAGVKITGSDMNDSETVGASARPGHPGGHRPQGGERPGGGLCHPHRRPSTTTTRRSPPPTPPASPSLSGRRPGGAIMRHYQNALCVAGTHGKTTTTSMCTQIFLAAQRDPTVMIGGTLPALGAGHRGGKGGHHILESCEYCNSFLSFFPTVAVILNVDADHLDFFKDLEDVKHSFRRFAQLVPEGGMVIADGDDKNTMDALKDLGKPMLTFGLEQGDIHAAGLTYEKGVGSFDLIYRGEDLGRVALQVPGVHNVRNALAAAGAALQLKVPFAAIQEGLHAFTGAGRRFERKGEYHGAVLYDDYAHHPGELRALLSTVKTLGYDRVVCAFQPHTYSRTKELFDDFVEVLQLPDKVLLAEIFAARETDTLGISSQDLADRIPGAEYCPTLEGVTDRLAQLAQPGDLLLTVGAGDIHLAGEHLLERAGS